MKKLIIVFLLLPIFSLIFIFTYRSQAFADVGVPPSPGGGITPGNKTDKISMEREKVVFDIALNDENSPFYDKKNSYGNDYHFAHVSADFEMKNKTASPVSMNLLFPFPSYGGYLEDWEDYFDPESKSNPALNLVVQVEGKNVDYTYDVYDIDTYVTTENNNEFYYSTGLKALSAVFPVTFKASSQTNIRVEYDVLLHPYIKSIYGYFLYILETGSHWDGSIGYGEIIFKFPNEVIPSVFDRYNDGFTLKGDKLIWEFTNLEPGKDDNVIVQYSPYLVSLWRDRKPALEDITASRSDVYSIPSGLDQDSNYLFWSIEGNPIYLLNKVTSSSNFYDRSEYGWWIAKIGNNEKPWVKYEFNAIYSIDSMIINSGIVFEGTGKTYELVGRPKKIRLTFSDGSSQTFDLQDNPERDINLNIQSVDTSSVQVSVLDVYPNYEGKKQWVGIDLIEFSPLIKKKEKSADTGITIPQSFLTENSSTTRIDQMSKKELKTVKNLTFEIVDKNKVVFSNTINLSGEETIERLKNLSEYLDFNTIGKISINTDKVPVLESPATITMYNLFFSNTPDIYKDGKFATNKEVSNIRYDKDTGTLKFDVSSFSTYEAKVRITDKNHDETTSTKTDTLRTVAFICFITIIVVIIIVVGMVILIIKRRNKRPNLNEKQNKQHIKFKNNRNSSESSKVEKQKGEDTK